MVHLLGRNGVLSIGVRKWLRWLVILKNWLDHYLAWLEVVGLGIVPLLVSIFQTRHNAIMVHCGIYVRTAVSTMLYRKALSVSAAGRAMTSTGQVVNMMSNDTMQIQRFLQFAGFTMTVTLRTTGSIPQHWVRISIRRYIYLCAESGNRRSCQ